MTNNEITKVFGGVRLTGKWQFVYATLFVLWSSVALGVMSIISFFVS